MSHLRWSEAHATPEFSLLSWANVGEVRQILQHMKQGCLNALEHITHPSVAMSVLDMHLRDLDAKPHLIFPSSLYADFLSFGGTSSAR